MLIAAFDEILGHPNNFNPRVLSQKRAMLLWTFENLSRSLLGSLASQQGGINKILLLQDKKEIIDNMKVLQGRFEKKHCIRK